ncbi:serine carboxypeptidase s28 domain-containing protein [Ditylenchus destructor]|nr:serine carboxypeptidase s28 domain-containing protein [Ditylenchus destructor]
MNIPRVTLFVIFLSVWIFGCYLVCNSNGYLNKYLAKYYQKVASMNLNHLNPGSCSMKPHERRDPKKWVSDNIVFGLKNYTLLKKKTKSNNECLRKLSAVKKRFNATKEEIPFFPFIGAIEQSLDHFNNTEKRTWHQYFAYSKAYSTNDSVNFLNLCGETAIDLISFRWSAAVVWAKQFGANFYVLEHRFYGFSQPFSGEAKVDLQYLSSEQALGDAAVFVRTVNERFNTTNPKWIVFGCSYAGMLSAWMRMKYPDIIQGAIASSAPVQATLEFRDYFQVSAKAFEKFGTKNCSNDIRRYFSAVQVLLLTEEGRKRLGVANDHDIFWYIFKHLPTSQFDDFQHNDITERCNNFKKMADDFSDPNKTVHWNGKCDIGSEGIVNGSVDSQTAWFWQKCTEFGYFQTTAIDGGIYDDAVLSLRNSIKQFCTYTFPTADFNENSIQAAVDKTNSFYGGNKNFNATNVVFVNGSEDPWHTLSVYDTPNDSVKSILVQDTSHCADYYAENAERESDPQDWASKAVEHKVVSKNRQKSTEIYSMDIFDFEPSQRKEAPKKAFAANKNVRQPVPKKRNTSMPPPSSQSDLIDILARNRLKRPSSSERSRPDHVWKRNAILNFIPTKIGTEKHDEYEFVASQRTYNILQSSLGLTGIKGPEKIIVNEKSPLITDRFQYILRSHDQK